MAPPAGSDRIRIRRGRKEEGRRAPFPLPDTAPARPDQADEFCPGYLTVVKYHVQVPEVCKIGIRLLLLHVSLRWRLCDPLDVLRFHYVQQIDDAIMALEPTKDVHLAVESDRIDLLVERASNALHSHVGTVAMIVGIIVRVFRFQ